MKKMIYTALIVGFILAACAPAPQTVYVVVTATGAPAAAPADTSAPPAPTNTSAPAAAPTDTPAPAAPTDTPAGPTDTAVPAQAASATLPPAVGGSAFTNYVQEGDHFSLKCSPGQITLGATAIDVQHVSSAYVSYRLQDKSSTTATTWGAPVKMTGDSKGDYTINFTALDIVPDSRLKNAWFDYQFIGLNSSSNVVGRSPIFSEKVSFTFDCP